MNSSEKTKTQVSNEQSSFSIGTLIGAGGFLLAITMGFAAGSFWLFVLTLVLVSIPAVMIQLEEETKKTDDFNSLCVNHGMRFREDLSNLHSNLFLGQSEKDFSILMRHPVSKDRVRDVFVNVNDILNIELSIDKSPVYEAGPISALSGAAIGGAVFGGSGAVVGSIASSQAGKGNIGSITLKLRINDLKSPLIQIEFIPEPTAPSLAKTPLTLAENWTNLIEVMRHRIAKSVQD